MGEPKTIRLSYPFCSSGIEITYVKRRKVLQISGWYDSCVSIEGREIPLEEFLSRLGIYPDAIIPIKTRRR